ncbi:response regulator [Diaphorobacter aerolatus]|uniref:Response regulator n=1 Tax=Diaphorobacter aerolatus TaxID=1288495 RepID=A0A7H0GJI8_9BURK|nr:response regulator [Diaphorobacter aerolatus]QNP48454.1 response regulator [Diaphorobacter aerolatus]
MNTNTIPSVLFVDDEERIVNQLRLIFRNGYTVHTATSGEEALKILHSTRIDVLVSDQRMPGMLGVELLEKARKLSPDTMRLLLTGYSDLAAIVGSVNEGEVFRFINKPWDHDEIQRIVADAVAAGEAARSAGSAATQEAAAQLLASTAANPPKVLLIDTNLSELQAMSQVLSTDQRCVLATSISEALEALSHNDIGVIVSEARVGRSDMGSFLHLLKQHHPMITTVMLSRAGDADLVIRMINKAQIFRFATKPLRKSSFQLAVAAAMKAHFNYRANPALVNRHRVAEDETAKADTSLVNSMMQSLSSFRQRFSLFGRKRETT